MNEIDGDDGNEYKPEVYYNSFIAYVPFLVLSFIYIVSSVSVQSLFAIILNFFKKIKLFIWKLRGHTPETMTDERIIYGKAWEEFCDTLKSAGASLVYGNTPMDPHSQAEGIRYLTRLLRGGLESYLECNDPTGVPKLVGLADIFRDAPVSIGGPNPDNIYQNANIDSRYEYRVYGNRGTVSYISFGTQSGSYGMDGGLKTVMSRDANDMEIKDDGSIEIYLSVLKPPNVPESNWLALNPSVTTAMFIVRQTFMLRNNEIPAKLQIERIGGNGKPTPLTAKHVEEALQKTGMLVAGASMLFSHWVNGFQKHTNKLPLFDQETSNKAGGDPSIRYYHSYWKLSVDEALVIKATPPECQTWNFQLDNYWMEALDARYFNIWINKGTASYRPDKSVRVVVAHRDPTGLCNKDCIFDWIDTCGHHEGHMLWRWVKPTISDDKLPAPIPTVVKLKDLSDFLSD